MPKKEIRLGDHYPPTPKGRWPICPNHGRRLYADNRGWGWRCADCKREGKMTLQPYRLNAKGKAYTISVREYLQ